MVLLLLLACVLVAVGPLARSAAAHTELLQASPGPGQRAGGTVDFIDLVFFEPVSDVELTLEAPDGSVIEGRTVVADGQIIRYEMPALAEPGRYIVRFQMISADGDVTRSGYFFDYEPDAIEPVRLGEDDLPSNTGTIVSVVAAVVFTGCVIGLVLLLLRRLERQRAAAQSDPEAESEARS